MKPSHKSIGPRQQKILDYICSRGFAAPEELARRQNVAPITVRRDLVWLENAGLLKRVHGGAVPGSAPLAITHAGVRMRIASTEKRTIAAAAATLVRPGERLFLDAGSTCAFLADALPNDMELTVITHSLDAIQKLTPKRGIHIITPGGELDERLNAFVGPATEAAIAAFHVDKAFLGTAGINLEAGFTDNSLLEERIKMLMSSHARETFILADSSKFGRVAFRSVLPLVKVSRIITDRGVSDRFRAAFRRKGIRIMSAR